MSQYPFKNLVFEGGGVTGLVYIGVLDILYSKKNFMDNIKRVGGTSAGAIVALLVSLNYTFDEIEEELKKLDMKNFMDDDWGIITDTSRFFFKYGWHKGEELLKWIKKIIENKTGNPNTTFEDINKSNNFKDLYIVGTNLSSHFSEIFSFEKTPHMHLAQAVRISISIPLFFEAVTYNDSIYIDGGVLNNYPVQLFDRKNFLINKENSSQPERYKKIKTEEGPGNPLVYNMETLGFRVDTKIQSNILQQKQIKNYKITNIYDFVKNLVGTVMDFQQNISYLDDDFDRTIYIDSLNVSAIDFNLSENTIENLIKSGKNCTEDYFKTYNNIEIPRKNRPNTENQI